MASRELLLYKRARSKTLTNPQRPQGHYHNAHSPRRIVLDLTSRTVINF